MPMTILVLFLFGLRIVSGFASPNNSCKWTNTGLESPTKSCLYLLNDPAMASAIASKLYPASMIGTIGEVYFRTRKEMECPRGAVAGFIAQIATVIIAIPMISVAKNAPGVQSFLEVDWLHFIETIMFWASIHVQCTTFRQAVLSIENNKSLPKSTVEYMPMVKALLLIFGSIFAIAMGHYYVNTDSWQHTKLFGGLLNPPTPGRKYQLLGELSFLTWIFHWSMIIDYCLTLPFYMWRWGDKDCTGNRKWKVYTALHFPAFLVNGIVIVNHLHRDQLVALKVLHPVLIFVGSITTLFGSFLVSRANEWSPFSKEKKNGSSFSTILSSEKEDRKTGRDWDASYTLASIAAGSLLSCGSLYLAV